MSSLFGSFVFVKHEKLEEFVLNIIGPDAAKKVAGFHPNLSTSDFNICNDKLHYSYTVGDQKIINECPFDMEFDENTFFEKKIKTVVTKYSDTQFNYVSTTFDGCKKFNRTYVLSPEGLTINCSEPQHGLTSTLFYKRA